MLALSFTVSPFRHKPHHNTFPVDLHQPSHVMVMEIRMQNAPAWDWLDSLGSKVRNAFDSFVVRAPKITLLAAKTVRETTSTSTPAAHRPQISVRESSPPMSCEPSAPSSCATARDQLTNDNQRRRLSFRPLPPITEEDATAKIQIREAIVALRLAVSDVDQLRKSTTESTNRRRSIHDLRGVREVRLGRVRDAVTALSNARSWQLFLRSSSQATEKESPPQYLSKSSSA